MTTGFAYVILTGGTAKYRDERHASPLAPVVPVYVNEVGVVAVGEVTFRRDH